MVGGIEFDEKLFQLIRIALLNHPINDGKRIAVGFVCEEGVLQDDMLVLHLHKPVVIKLLQERKDLLVRVHDAFVDFLEIQQLQLDLVLLIEVFDGDVFHEGVYHFVGVELLVLSLLFLLVDEGLNVPFLGGRKDLLKILEGNLLAFGPTGRRRQLVFLTFI